MLNNISLLGLDHTGSAFSPEAIEWPITSRATDVDVNQNIRISPLVVPQGEWFDEGFDLRNPEGQALTNAVINVINAIDVRGRKRRLVDEANYRIIVRKILANGLRAFYYYRPSLVAFQRKANSYKGRAPWLNGKAMKRATDLMQRAGLIEISVGELGVASSTYSLTHDLLIVAGDNGVTDQSLIYDLPAERLVRLYRSNSDDREAVTFTMNSETIEWTKKLDHYNRFIAEQSIEMAVSATETRRLTAKLNSSRKMWLPRLTRPELTKTGLYRQFNNSSFYQGGRLYGAWWITCPQKLRPSITINGEPTVELDYSGCAIRMLYHEQNMDCEGDPYFIDIIDACERDNGLSIGYFREDVKQMTQALINGRRGGCGERCKLPPRRTFKPYFTRSEVMMEIKQKHRAIATSFQTGAWGRLQRADSDIAIDVISKLASKGICALPVHDSFIVNERYKDELSSQMVDSYVQNTGFYPVIK